MSFTEPETVREWDMKTALNKMGIKTELWDAVSQFLGGPASVQDIALFPPAFWRDAVTNVKVGDAALSPFEKVKLGFLWQTCRKAHRRSHDDPLDDASGRSALRAMTISHTMYWHHGGCQKYEGDESDVYGRFHSKERPAILCKDGRVLEIKHDYEEWVADLKGFAVLEGTLKLPGGNWCVYHLGGIHKSEHDDFSDAAIKFGECKPQPAVLVENGNIIKSRDPDTNWYRMCLGALI